MVGLDVQLSLEGTSIVDILGRDDGGAQVELLGRLARVEGWSG